MKEERKLRLSRETVRLLGDTPAPRPLATPKMRHAEGGFSITTACWAFFHWYFSNRVKRQLAGPSGYMSCRCTDRTC